MAKRLTLTPLEVRPTPATVNFAAGHLTITATAPDEWFAVNNDATGVTVDVTTTGGSFGPYSGVNQITIQDAGNFGGQNVRVAGTAFNLSGAFSYTGIERVALAAPLTASNATIRAADLNVRAAVSAASVSIAPLAGGRMDLGSTAVLGTVGQSFPGLNPGDTYHVAFVTANRSGISTTTSIPTDYPHFGGLLAADYNVTVAAADAGLVQNWDGDEIIWNALLSASKIDVRDRIAINGPVYNMAGLKVAYDKADLWDGTLDAPNPLRLVDLAPSPL